MRSAFEQKSGADPVPVRPPIAVDINRYQAMLDGSDLSEAQKRDFIETVWQIVLQFVDLGFGAHPLRSIPSGADGGAISLDDLLAGALNSDELPEGGAL